MDKPGGSHPETPDDGYLKHLKSPGLKMHGTHQAGTPSLEELQVGYTPDDFQGRSLLVCPHAVLNEKARA